MPIPLSQLGSKLGFTEAEMKKYVLELGFDATDELADDIVELIMDDFQGKTEKSAADIYDELAAEEREKEIVRSQRKKKAGKVTKKKKNGDKRTKSTTVTGIIEIPENISVKELAEKTGVSAAVLIGALMKNGILANINQVIDFDTALIITDGLSVDLKKALKAATAEDLFRGNLDKLLDEDQENLSERAPVVCIMGHVDHGKTTLLDSIREANVVSTESGGITQHIGAYQVYKNGKKVTFLDTPGHEAFTAMRARGARATDVAILVVAADDGVMPQTEEAINHAKEAGVPIIVAINKMDKEGANVDRVKAELAEKGLQPEEWGGDTIMVPVSALKSQGLDDLVESVLLVSEVLELKANPDRNAVATIIESHLDPNFGPVATVLINTGTLEKGDNFILGKSYGRVKIMTDQTGKRVKSIGPSDTAQLAGLNEVAESGQILQAVNSEKIARQGATAVHGLIHEEMIQTGMGMQEILQRIKEGSLNLLKIVLKADAQGSLEAIKQSLARVKSDDVAIKVIHSGVGSISESDVMMAAASPGTLVLGFHTEANGHVRRIARDKHVEVVTYEVIYKLIEDLTNILAGMLEPEIIDIELGRYKVKRIFFTGKGELVLGGEILDGLIRNQVKVRVVREKVQVGEGEIIGLKLVNEDMKELFKGQECGVRFKGKFAVQEGDILEAWTQETRLKTLDPLT
jgi:translation initiation factor IF-2